MQKALINNNFDSLVKKKFKEICKIVKNNIKDSPFPEKMCEYNVKSIKKELYNLFSKDVVDALVDKIIYEFNNINFDEPFAVDLKKLAKDINTLSNGGKIVVPKYSFKTGEVEYYKQNTIDGSRCDLFIIEGIYTLNDEVINNIDSKNTLKIAINCDLKSLISRKLDRDITKGRSTLTKEQIIISYLTQVMPSYFKYIYPTFSYADLIYSSTLTNEEKDERTDSKQTKYLASANIEQYLAELGANFVSSHDQTDYFLEDKYNNLTNNIVLRIREENQKATHLTIKTQEDINNLNRKVEEYSLLDGFGEENNNISNILNKFVNVGFGVSTIVRKKRKIYKLDNILIKLDNFEGNLYVEFDNISESLQKKLCSELYLLDNITQSYYELKNNQEEHSEIELKLKISGNIDEFISKNQLIGKVISQTYLNLHDKNTINYIKSFLPNNFDISKYSEARVRTINNKQCFLTLKSDGTLKRLEFEKEIPFFVAKNLDKLSLIGSVKKVRYDIILQDFTISLDKYLNKDLCVAEVEFDDKLFANSDVIQKVKQILTDFNIEDVTHKQEYKNHNLAK